jgi:uncharacterized protein YrrD
VRRKEIKMTQFNFHMGVHVQCTNGQCGKLAGVVINPDSQHITDLIVEKGFLLKHDRILPVSVMKDATEENVFLSVSSNELDQYPEYRVIEYEEPATGLEQQSTPIATPYMAQGALDPVVPMVKKKIREGIGPGQKVIMPGTHVNNIHGTFGTVDHILMNPENKEITHLVVRRGTIFSDHLVIPISMVEEVREDSIFVTGTDEELKELPRYTPPTEADIA